MHKYFADRQCDTLISQPLIIIDMRCSGIGLNLNEIYINVSNLVVSVSRDSVIVSMPYEYPSEIFVR